MGDGAQYAKVTEGEKYIYGIFDNGTAIKTLKSTYAESPVKMYLNRNMATVKMNGKDYTLKNLVAKHFLNGYKPGDFIETVDGNPLNCRISNLRKYTHSEHGKRTGYRSRSKSVVANGVKYRSVRQCAKALHVSYQALLDYIGDKPPNHSVLSGVTIELEGEQEGKNE